ncbi:hypothetical protein GGX14DRAFT_391565 [Mycena pura]|uniref:Uncharacterized protein n=1 Tax=Mycena pura TaxID=153505 RepID=A0AAD6VPN6_9AGAR|nr:hypothetical protein GGX14DRAFT_391565 [Mycena pura]
MFPPSAWVPHLPAALCLSTAPTLCPSARWPHLPARCLPGCFACPPPFASPPRQLATAPVAQDLVFRSTTMILLVLTFATVEHSSASNVHSPGPLCKPLEGLRSDPGTTADSASAGAQATAPPTLHSPHMGQAQCWLILLLFRVSQKNSPGTELCPFDLALARRVARDVRKRRGGARHPAQPNVGVADSDELEGRSGSRWLRISAAALDIMSRDMPPTSGRRGSQCIFPLDVSGVADNDEREGRDGAGIYGEFFDFCENFLPDISSVADNDEHKGGGGGGGGSGSGIYGKFFEFFAKISRPTSAAGRGRGRGWERERVAAHQRHSADVTSRNITPASGGGEGARRIVGIIANSPMQPFAFLVRPAVPGGPVFIPLERRRIRNPDKAVRARDRRRARGRSFRRIHDTAAILGISTFAYLLSGAIPIRVPDGVKVTERSAEMIALFTELLREKAGVMRMVTVLTTIPQYRGSLGAM